MSKDLDVGIIKILKNQRKHNPSFKKQIKIFEENKEWIFREEPKIIGEDAFEEFYAEFERLNGLDDKETYRKNLAVFYKITFTEFVIGHCWKTDDEKDGSWKTRQECWDCWCGYIKNRIDAQLYYDSVNNIHIYT